jgi:hypothetical protein
MLKKILIFIERKQTLSFIRQFTQASIWEDIS